MQYDSSIVAFGRHESFGLRYGWLTKGVQAFLENNDVFDDDDATAVLGVGKNMVRSMKYWLQAYQILEKKNGNNFKVTAVGDYIFGSDGVDRYVEDDATLWLLHWLICSNYELATAFYWFFNKYHRVEFKVDDVALALRQFVCDKIGKDVNKNTLKKESSVLLRMYSRTSNSKDEDFALESPFSSLGLVDHFENERVYRSRLSSRYDIPVGVFCYSLLKCYENYTSKEIPLESLMYSKNGVPTLGSIFRLSEEGFVCHIEKVVNAFPGVFVYSDSSGLRQLFLNDRIDPMICLNHHYTY